MISDLLSYVVLAFVGVRLVDGLRHSLRGTGRSTAARLVRGIRWRHLWPVLPVLVLVATAATALMQLPGLDWGWWTAIGGAGNPVTGSTAATQGSIWEWIIPLVFVGLLLPTLPLFALGEERVFRLGAEDWSRRKRAVKTVQFGMVHALIGIPLGAAMALTIGGVYFLRIYLAEFARSKSAQSAVFESARAHTAYNGVIMVLVIALAVATAVG